MTVIVNLEELHRWLHEMAISIEQNDSPNPLLYAHFMQEPEVALTLVEVIDAMDEATIEDNRDFYSACIFALDICVAQLQAGIELHNKVAGKMLEQVMANMSKAIATQKHSLSFWLPVLNAFYEVHVELSEDLKDAYFDLASQEDVISDDEDEEVSHLNSIRDLIEELSDLSIFDIAENFFAQSYAMPADFFTDLVVDLYSIEEGQEIALLTLMHPKQDVRDIVVATLDQLMDNVTLSPASLSRLQTIKNWYPAEYHEQFDRWIKKQRKKGVVFNAEMSVAQAKIKASEVDGTGAQGIFIHLKKERKNRLCGLLFKQATGIKDAWITPVIPAKDVKRYYTESFDDSVMLREVDVSYLLMMTNHFLALSIERGDMPDLHLLEMQEELGLYFKPQKIDAVDMIEQFAVQIVPFTPDAMEASLARSKTWPKNKRFTESWFVENAQIDKLVNRCCSFVDGTKVCRFEEAMAAVFAQELEQHRDYWMFHFLWITLWLRSKSRKNDKSWQDSFFIAHAIQSGMALNTIPIMHEICYQSVVNSIETMQERRTYLNQE